MTLTLRWLDTESTEITESLAGSVNSVRSV